MSSSSAAAATTTTKTTTTDLPKMQYVRLGKTGLRVSRICLGCMSYGSSKWSPWVKDEKESIEYIKKAYEIGINFFDTADVYSYGESERVLGKALKEIGADRGRVVIATKVYMPVYDNFDEFDPIPEDKAHMVNCFGLSRKHIFDAVEASLKRLGVDYIDIYQIHRHDPNTPMEETMEALNDLVRSGKVRYIGASTMSTWQFQKYNNIAERHGWAKFISMQNLYNLIYREEEREMIPYCMDSGIAGGELLAKKRNTVRNDTYFVISKFHPEVKADCNEIIIDRVTELAKKHNVSNAQIAMAWELSKPFITAPILGVSKIEQLYDSVRGLDLKLTKEEIKYLEEPYTPKYPI
ncbi:NADP-dependent oxidoreductase domain-containing protein [Cokeromyces recurvatus]|uniref:NADP-dependent oxidoreductase domain-containing protein n=1 Tax=Cokeromyces recurvatus TaxID=90255 RepID=UPI00221E9B9F|nr:NADP-dependent oxidoreductase domain-containing protein [Cokeromyces recurvatus]KAI7898539.1 NADP-dependent oxidoreductase domain-containing protein [Cokeromyces recurvatus]